MTKINFDDPSIFQVDHEVRQMPVANTEDILAHGEGREGTKEMGTEELPGRRRDGGTLCGGDRKGHTTPYVCIVIQHRSEMLS